MRAEARTFSWAALLLGATFLASGCVTLTPRPGGGASEGPRALSSLRETGASTPSVDGPAPLASTEVTEPESLVSGEPGEQERLHRRRSARGLGPDAALARAEEAPASEVASAPAPEGPPSCGEQAVLPGWPDYSSWDTEALLAPFLTCTSPGEVLALQERVDMPRLVDALDDWRAVRLGALGPPREDVARLLNEKRTALLLKAPRAYGHLNAQVLSVFIVDSAYDDDLREILFLLAQEKRLEETLKLLPAFQAALEKRGLKPTARVEPDSRLGQAARGLRQLGEDVLSSSPMAEGGPDFAFQFIRGQLPLEYQEALTKAEQELVANASADSMAVSAFDHLTFGVPLGAYGLLANTVHGGYLITQGNWEQGTREVTPGLVLALFLGGKGVRYLAQGEGAAGVRLRIASGVEAAEARLRVLTETARRFQSVLSVEGLRELVREVRSSREAGRFVAAGGADAALALHEAGGDVARARPLMSRARPGATGSGSPPGKSGAGAGAGEAAAADEAARLAPAETRSAGGQGTLASLVDEGAGHTPQVVEAKLAAAELEATGPRLPKDVGVLEKHRPSLEAPPPEAQDNPRWREYVDYYERRLKEVKEGTAAEGPLKWEGYARMRAWFARGMAFEADRVKLLKADAEKPRAQRTFLRDFNKPRVETQVGVRKPGPGLCYADVLVIEEGELGGQPRRVESFSFKSRDLSGLDPNALRAQLIEDAREALSKYGERLDIRRDSLQRLLPEGSEVPIQRVRLIYEGGALKPTNPNFLDGAVNAAQEKVPGVEVSFQ